MLEKQQRAAQAKEKERQLDITMEAARAAALQAQQVVPGHSPWLCCDCFETYTAGSIREV